MNQLTAFSAPPYQPVPMDVPAELAIAGWPDGELPIIGNDGMATVLDPLNERFSNYYPGVRFATTLRGSATAIPALTAGATWFAPMSRDPWRDDAAAFVRARGYPPTPVRIGYTGHGPRETGRTPPAIYVHIDNPLSHLTLSQLKRIFTTGDAQGDITCWAQVGLATPWATRRIHIYGMRDTKYARGLRDIRFGGRPYGPHYEALPHRDDVIRAVAQDPFGIGAVGWIEAARISRQVRVLPLAADETSGAESPDLAYIAAGGYALKAWLSLFLDLAPGQPLPALLREYLRLALSQEGQLVIAAQTHRPEGYVPLCEDDWTRQTAQCAKL